MVHLNAQTELLVPGKRLTIQPRGMLGIDWLLYSKNGLAFFME